MQWLPGHCLPPEHQARPTASEQPAPSHLPLWLSLRGTQQGYFCCFSGPLLTRDISSSPKAGPGLSRGRQLEGHAILRPTSSFCPSDGVPRLSRAGESGSGQWITLRCPSRKWQQGRGRELTPGSQAGFRPTFPVTPHTVDFLILCPNPSQRRPASPASLGLSSLQGPSASSVLAAASLLPRREHTPLF